MIWKPNVTVAAIIEQRGKFLLVEERVDGDIVLNQPAGHLEEGESLIQAVIRETLEETAWHFIPEALIGIYRWQSPRNKITYLRFAFTGKPGQHDVARALDTGIIRAVWMSQDEIKAARAQHRSPQVERGIDDYLAGQRYPLACLSDFN